VRHWSLFSTYWRFTSQIIIIIIIISPIVLCNKKNTKKTGFTLILKALLKPLAKKPPNGPITDANSDMEIEWKMNG